MSPWPCCGWSNSQREEVEKTKSPLTPKAAARIKLFSPAAWNPAARSLKRGSMQKGESIGGKDDQAVFVHEELWVRDLSPHPPQLKKKDKSKTRILIFLKDWWNPCSMGFWIIHKSSPIAHIYLLWNQIWLTPQKSGVSQGLWHNPAAKVVFEGFLY